MTVRSPQGVVRCREEGCGAEVVMVRTWCPDDPNHKSKWMPLDPTKYPISDVRATALLSRGPYGTPRARIPHKGEEPWPEEERRMPHFATCKARTRKPRSQRTIDLTGLPDNVIPFRRPKIRK